MDRTDEEQQLEKQLDERDRVYEESWWWDLRRQYSKCFAAESKEMGVVFHIKLTDFF